MCYYGNLQIGHVNATTDEMLTIIVCKLRTHLDNIFGGWGRGGVKGLEFIGNEGKVHVSHTMLAPWS